MISLASIPFCLRYSDSRRSFSLRSEFSVTRSRICLCSAEANTLSSSCQALGLLAAPGASIFLTVLSNSVEYVYDTYGGYWNEPSRSAPHSGPFFSRLPSVISSNAVIPRLKMSDFFRSGSSVLLSSSLAKQRQSPSGMLTSSVILVKKRAIPRSAILKFPVLPYRMFSGLMSRCTMSLLCSSSKPKRTSRIIFLREPSERAPWCGSWSYSPFASCFLQLLQSTLASCLIYRSDFSQSSMTI